MCFKIILIFHFTNRRWSPTSQYWWNWFQDRGVHDPPPSHHLFCTKLSLGEEQDMISSSTRALGIGRTGSTVLVLQKETQAETNDGFCRWSNPNTIKTNTCRCDFVRKEHHLLEVRVRSLLYTFRSFFKLVDGVFRKNILKISSFQSYIYRSRFPTESVSCRAVSFQVRRSKQFQNGRRSTTRRQL
jgi:hypothetical protein